jgi:hypothetical protein
MTIISTSWTCQRCAATCTDEPPWHRLCDPCVADLQALAQQALPHTATCPSCGGPCCPQCGDAMPLIVPVPVPPDAPDAAQLAEQLIAYRPLHPKAGTGDER